MKCDDIRIKIGDKDAYLSYNAETWKLTLWSPNSPQPEFEVDMNNIQKLYISSYDRETHGENKNQLARTVIGGTLFGPIGAIIGAVSGNGKKEIVDATYACIHIETKDQHLVVLCKETPQNNSTVFVKTVNGLMTAGSYKAYRKKGTKNAIIAVLIAAAAILLQIVLGYLLG